MSPPRLLAGAGLVLLGCVRVDAGDTGVLPPRVQVSAGHFVQGCDPGEAGCEADEQPARTVGLSSFEIATTELTVGDLAACVAAGACEEALGADPDSPADHPAVGLDRDGAAAACAWLGGRLPTEAEWARAARGDDGRRHPWGDDDADCTRAWVPACGVELVAVDTLPAGASPWGLHHTTGNAWEWVQDGYDADYYAEAPSDDPPGPAADGVHTVRGASTWSDGAAAPIWRRSPAVQGAACARCGARCAWDLP